MQNKSDIQFNLVEFTIGNGFEISNQDTPAFKHFSHFQAIDSIDKLEPNSQDFGVFVSFYTENILNELKSVNKLLNVIKSEGYLSIVINAEFHKDVISIINKNGKLDIKVCKEYDDVYLIVMQKSLHVIKVHSYERVKLNKTAMVIRFGAIGDLLQTSSVCKGLKQQGYKVALITQKPSHVVLDNDPNIDKMIVLEKDQVPNQALGTYFKYLESEYDKVINLCESVEGTLLAMKDRPSYKWSHKARHSIMNKNYNEFMHELAEVPNVLQVKFYPTLQEKKWAVKERAKMGDVVVMWALAGSSVHKSNAQLDDYVTNLLTTYSNVDVILIGGEECKMLESGWEDNKRVHLRSGVWGIRETLTMIDYVDLIIGPETGVLNAAACIKVPKILFLSHSSEENLSRDWTNTTSLNVTNEELPCYPCHKLHFGWDSCHQDAITGTALCQSMLKLEDTITASTNYLSNTSAKISKKTIKIHKV